MCQVCFSPDGQVSARFYPALHSHVSYNYCVHTIHDLVGWVSLQGSECEHSGGLESWCLARIVNRIRAYLRHYATAIPLLSSMGTELCLSFLVQSPVCNPVLTTTTARCLDRKGSRALRCSISLAISHDTLHGCLRDRNCSRLSYGSRKFVRHLRGGSPASMVSRRGYFRIGPRRVAALAHGDQYKRGH